MLTFDLARSIIRNLKWTLLPLEVESLRSKCQWPSNSFRMYPYSVEVGINLRITATG